MCGSNFVLPLNALQEQQDENTLPKGDFNTMIKSLNQTNAHKLAPELFVTATQKGPQNAPTTSQNMHRLNSIYANDSMIKASKKRQGDKQGSSTMLNK